MTPGAGARDGEPAGTEALSRHLLRPVGAGRVGGSRCRCLGAGLEGSGRVCRNVLIFPSEPES